MRMTKRMKDAADKMSNVLYNLKHHLSTFSSPSPDKLAEWRESWSKSCAEVQEEYDAAKQEQLQKEAARREAKECAARMKRTVRRGKAARKAAGR